MQEIMKNEIYSEEIQMKSQDFYEKEKLLQEESNKELPPPVQTQIKGHACSVLWKRRTLSDSPPALAKPFSQDPDAARRQAPQLMSVLW